MTYLKIIMLLAVLMLIGCTSLGVEAGKVETKDVTLENISIKTENTLKSED